MRLMQGRPVVENNVIVGSDQPISCMPFGSIPAANPRFGRNLVWGNSAPAVWACSSSGEIVSDDPGFCDPGADDYSVCEGSPCLSYEEPLGAFGAGCANCQVPTVTRSFGRAKARYR